MTPRLWLLSPSMCLARNRHSRCAGRHSASYPKERWRNLKRNIRREGVSYVFFRSLFAVRQRLEKWADEIIPVSEVEQLLETGFPGRSLPGLARRHGFRFTKRESECGPSKRIPAPSEGRSWHRSRHPYSETRVVLRTADGLHQPL